MTRNLSSYRWTPGLFDDFRKELNRLADGVFDSEEGGTPFFSPTANFAETDKAYEVSVDVAGVSPEDVHVDFKDGHLWITGERKQEHEEQGKTFHRVERRYGKFRRVVSLGNDVDAERIEANYTNGVLQVTLPKLAAVLPKRIAVKS